MALRGTLAGISGRRVFFRAEDAPDRAAWQKGLAKEETEGKSKADLDARYKKEVVQEFRLSGDGAPKVLRQRAEPEKVKSGDDEIERPAYDPLNAADLRNGMAVRLMGPPTADLHTIVVLPDDEQPDEHKLVKAAPKAAAKASHPHAAARSHHGHAHK